MKLLTIISSIMASKTFDGSGKVCVCFMKMSSKVKNKALVNNYTVITCVFRKKSNSTLSLVE